MAEQEHWLQKLQKATERKALEGDKRASEAEAVAKDLAQALERVQQRQAAMQRADEIGLTDQQQAAIRDTVRGAQVRTKELMEKVQEARREFTEELKREEIDGEKLKDGDPKSDYAFELGGIMHGNS